MSLSELIAHIQALPQADKACLMKSLLNDLAEENKQLAEANANKQ